MIETIFIGVAVALAAVLAYAATKPNVLRVQRSASIEAPPDRIFALINDLNRWTAWSPYETKDPAMKRSLSGAASGKGAVYEWDGNKAVGKGRMEITDSAPSSRVTIKLDFVKPFEANNTVDFTLVPRGDATEVTWAMRGPSPYLAKVIGLFFDMDKMIGTDFEAGLARLKTVAEN